MVLDHPPEAVWAVIRPFDHYAWAGVETEVSIEDGKAGDQVGAIRRFEIGGRFTKQVLLAHSDVERSYTYAFSGPCPFPVEDYRATIRVLPITADGRSLVEWWATFDCDLDERAQWVEHFEQKGFKVWLEALRRFMDGAARAQLMEGATSAQRMEGATSARAAQNENRASDGASARDARTRWALTSLGG
jgi:hypothetical protein